VSSAFFASASPSEPRPIQRPLRVLVVDDEPDTVLSLVTLLRAEGYEAKGAKDGIQALMEMEALDPDVMVVDIAMPKMSGWDVAREVRTPGRHRRPVLIAISGTYVKTPDLILARAVGFSHFLPKPCNPNFLFSLLAAVTPST
jgi:CheY-like chemotaxis protein